MCSGGGQEYNQKCQAGRALDRIIYLQGIVRYIAYYTGPSALDPIVNKIRNEEMSPPIKRQRSLL